MLSLIRYRREMSLTSEGLLLARWTRADATVSAVVADAIHGGAVDHGGVVNIVNGGDIHIGHGAVVEEPAAFPASTVVAVAEVSEAVVDAAVETDLWTPITFIE